MKQCTTCKETKELSEFYSQIKKNAKNEQYTYIRPDCKECTKAASLKFMKANPEKRKEYLKKDNAKPEKKKLIKKLKKESRERGELREWQRNNKDKLANYRNSRANKTHDISKEEWENCKEYFNNECAYCGIHISEHFNAYAGELKHTDFHKEHVEHTGSNDITNCVPSCKACNSSKHDSLLEDWYTHDNPKFSEERINKIYSWLFEDVYELA